MVKTHLPAHMDSVRQKLRPKHQLLILKCYPRLPKNSAADVKPNGSELSYLLYYASTRRSKLQKVGAFLERKTAVDVSRYQSARVLVTLQILTALLENKVVGAGSGFALIAPYVLRILKELLQHTTDISLIEASLETWASFCHHQDEATLKADHEYRELFESVVRQYAIFADRESKIKLGRSTQPVAVQDAIRLREAGLGAIKSVLTSDSLASESGRQLDVVVPAILNNMRGEDDVYLTNLLRLGKQYAEDEKEKALSRRFSMATTRTHTGTTDDSTDADPRQAAGTIQDADEYAEEEVAILALECLREAFAHETRSLVRGATIAVLSYLSRTQTRPQTKTHEHPKLGYAMNTWASKLFEICTSWTPVQDRFVLIVTLVETLVRLPLQNSDIELHIMYTNLVDHILYSDLNLIGLSVMDVLLSLVQQILKVLRLSGASLGGRGSSGAAPGAQEEKISEPPQSPRESQAGPKFEARIELARMLQQAIAHLGTHVYYTDQISDMISAILLRLKPNPAPTGHQNPVITAAAIEEPTAVVGGYGSTVSLPARGRSSATRSGFFSFESARQIALETVRDILRTSNSSRSLSTGGVSNSRNKVPITIWEGTQWLLRDPSHVVRRAYVDALTTWLKLETSKADMRVKIPKDKPKKKTENAFARRAFSNASNKKDKQSKKATNTFLQLLHLAVFEDALQFSSLGTIESEKEMRALHFLLSTLIQRLGVNAVQSGLPMIFALQEEMVRTDSVATKVGLGSLVLGYLWTLADVYDFDVSPVGQEIFSEIKRRKETGLWIADISMPPKPLEDISSRSLPASEPAEGSQDAIKPFEHRQELVERIGDSYALTAASPSPSAPGSPGRTPGTRRLSATVPPTLDRTATSYLNVKPQANPLLPEKVRESMLEIWTKEGCLSAIAAAAPKSISLSGSHSSPSQALAAGNHRQLLAAANTRHSPRNGSPLPPNQRAGGTQAEQPGQQALGANLVSESPARRQSQSTAGKVSSSGGVHGRLRVDDLKKILSGAGLTTVQAGRFSNSAGDDQDAVSESLVDVGGEDLGSEYEGFVTPPSRVEDLHANSSIPPTIPEDLQVTPKARNPVDEEPPPLRLHNDVNGASPLAPNGIRPPSSQGQGKYTPSRGGASIKSKSGQSRKELIALLAGIGSDEKPADEGMKFPTMGKPPY